MPRRDKQPVMLDGQVIIRIAGFVQEQRARVNQTVPPHRSRSEQGKRDRFAATQTAQQIGPLAFGQCRQQRSDPIPGRKKGRCRPGSRPRHSVSRTVSGGSISRRNVIGSPDRNFIPMSGAMPRSSVAAASRHRSARLPPCGNRGIDSARPAASPGFSRHHQPARLHDPARSAPLASGSIAARVCASPCASSVSALKPSSRHAFCGSPIDTCTSPIRDGT